MLFNLINSCELTGAPAMKLYIHVQTCPRGTYNSVEQHNQTTCDAHPKCSRGELLAFEAAARTTYAKGQCTICMPGQYQPTDNHMETACRLHPVCQPGQKYQAGNESEASVCVPCEVGKYQDARNHSHASCKPIAGAISCRYDQHVSNNSKTEPTCLPCPGSTVQDEQLHHSVVCNERASNTDDNTTPSDWGPVVGGVVGGVTLAVVLLVVLALKNKRGSDHSPSTQTAVSARPDNLRQHRGTRANSANKRLASGLKQHMPVHHADDGHEIQETGMYDPIGKGVSRNFSSSSKNSFTEPGYTGMTGITGTRRKSGDVARKNSDGDSAAGMVIYAANLDLRPSNVTSNSLPPKAASSVVYADVKNVTQTETNTDQLQPIYAENLDLSPASENGAHTRTHTHR